MSTKLTEALFAFLEAQEWPQEQEMSAAQKALICSRKANEAVARYADTKSLFGVPEIDINGLPQKWVQLAAAMLLKDIEAYAPNQLSEPLLRALMARAGLQGAYITHIAWQRAKVGFCLGKPADGEVADVFEREIKAAFAEWWPKMNHEPHYLFP